MDIVRAFNTNTLHTEIIIKGTNENPLFRASDIGEVLDVAYIRSTIRDYNETEKVVLTMHTPGGEQQITFLTEKGLYKVLFKSRKPIAEQFQNWVCEVIKDIRLQGVYSLQKQLNDSTQQFDAKLIHEKAIEKQRILLNEYGASGSCVYIIKVKSFENGSYIVKIGESRRGVEARYNEHKSKYEEVLLLDCFSVLKSKDMERFLHCHEQIRPYRVNNLVGHEHEIELFLIGQGISYQTLLHIIQLNLTTFNTYQKNDIEILQKENDTLKSLIQGQSTSHDISSPLLLQNILDNQKHICESIQKIDTRISQIEIHQTHILEKVQTSQTRTTTNFNTPLPTLGPRLQQINPDTMTLHKVYESVAECMKLHHYKFKRPSIDKAVKEHKIYRGYRWNYVERDQDPHILQDLVVTKVTRLQNIGYIAQLNQEKTQIMNVYLDRKTAAVANGYSISGIDTHVKKGSIAHGHYYILYDQCPDELIQVFEERHGGSPILYKDGVGQFDSQNNLIQEFICKYDCIKRLKISGKTLEKTLDKDVLYNQHYFRSMGNKLIASM